VGVLRVTQFAVAAFNQNEVGRAVLSDWSQPRRELGRFTAHSLPLGSDETGNLSSRIDLQTHAESAPDNCVILTFDLLTHD